MDSLACLAPSRAVRTLPSLLSDAGRCSSGSRIASPPCRSDQRQQQVLSEGDVQPGNAENDAKPRRPFTFRHPLPPSERNDWGRCTKIRSRINPMDLDSVPFSVIWFSFIGCSVGSCARVKDIIEAADTHLRVRRLPRRSYHEATDRCSRCCFASLPVFAVSVEAGLMEMLSRMGNRPIQSVQGSGSTTARMIANATI